jgi:Protein of unknown function (DUF3455)
MSYNFGQQTKNSARVRAPYVAALVLACAFGTVTLATAQTVTPPPTPTAITPPAGNSAFLVGHAFGSQGYTCLPTSTGATSWTVNPAARPEATLFATFFGQPVQIITHFASESSSQYLWGATRHGRVLSTPAKCGQQCWGRIRSSLGPTPRVARIQVRFPASYWSQSGTKRDQPAVISWPKPHSSSA